ncbi:polysaccharide biosynthesis protein [Halobacillus halophilus]|uniref:polysaccharide biosynthesis protein n=1 Tax=Halobacillus halophilus TaxID=1570 RepID=UPI001CD51E30|nr:nucleoside-diphosphate sugar epimerase/dehydratase [Halobacillus halophilus]MCA1012692.1 polysaccharide biosynthesis protein [Halobacillus halophilus]
MMNPLTNSVKIRLTFLFTYASMLAVFLLMREDMEMAMGELNLSLYFFTMIVFCIITCTSSPFRTFPKNLIYASTASLISYTGLLFSLSIHTEFLIHPLFTLYLIAVLLYMFSGLQRTPRHRVPAYKRYRWKRKNTLIIGAGSAGSIVANELRYSPDSTLHPVGYLDDQKSKISKKINGVKVLGSTKRLPYFIEKLEIDTVIIAIPSAPRHVITNIVKKCKEMNVTVKTVPKLVDIIEGKLSMKMIRDVKVEDLLGREPIKLDLQPITGYMRDKVILVTGAGGSIGSELCRQIMKFNPRHLLLLGRGENSVYTIENELKRLFPTQNVTSVIADVQDEISMQRVFSHYMPEVIFHAAAHKHVPLMEKQPEEAIKNNVFGTKVVAECAHRYGSERFILISTDKAVNPTSVMGATKRIAETLIQQYNAHSQTKYAAVRFGNVLGSRGSVVLLFKEQIASGGPVTVTHPEMIRYFMTIPEGVQLVIQAGSYATGGEIFLLDMGEQMKIVDLASDLIRLSGLEPGKDIKIEFTGIRPGEKLFEEMLLAEEGNGATKHELIYEAKLASFSEEELFGTLHKLDEMIHSRNDVAAHTYKETISNFITTYKPFPSKNY